MGDKSATIGNQLHASTTSVASYESRNIVYIVCTANHGVPDGGISNTTVSVSIGSTVIKFTNSV